MPLPPQTPVRITLRRAFRFGQIGRIDKQIVHSDPGKNERMREAIYWVTFGEGPGGCFSESEIEEAKR